MEGLSPTPDPSPGPDSVPSGVASATEGGIGIIVNPHASGNRRNPERSAKLGRIVGDAGQVFATQNIEELRQRLEDLHRSRIAVLGLCGGDGSISHGLSEALEVWGEDPLPPVVVLRGGTINNISRSLGGPRRVEQGVERIVAALGKGQALNVHKRAMIRVNGERHGYIVGAGLITHFLELYYEGARPGPARAAWLLLRLGLSWLVGGPAIQRVVPTIPASLRADQKLLDKSGFTLILASSVESIGLGVRPFYFAGRELGRFHMLAGDPSAGQLLGRLGHFWRGFPPRLDPLYDLAVGHLEICFEEPQRYTIDGELFGPTSTLTLDQGPTVTFIAA